MYRHRHLEYKVSASSPLSHESFYLLKGELNPAHFERCELTFLSLLERAMVLKGGGYARPQAEPGFVGSKVFIISVFFCCLLLY